MGVDNRRTMCDHCSLRADLPPFIDHDHAQSNANRIAEGDIFKCHMVMIPGQPAKRCLGAALIAGAELDNEPAEHLPPVYSDLKEYVASQGGGRLLSGEMELISDRWKDAEGREWMGFWRVSPTGKWGYFLSTREENELGSAYLFFDQAEELFGPLKKAYGSITWR